MAFVDSDGDGILDRYEGTSDPDGDGIPSFRDLVSGALTSHDEGTRHKSERHERYMHSNIDMHKHVHTCRTRMATG